MSAHKTLSEIREEIKAQRKDINKPYADTLITLNLQMAYDNFGEAVKNQLIDEFELEKYGWKKNSKEITRKGEFDFNKPF